MGAITVLREKPSHFEDSFAANDLVMRQLSEMHVAAMLEGRDPNGLADLAGMFSRLVDELHDAGAIDDHAVARVVGLDQHRVRTKDHG